MSESKALPSFVAEGKYSTGQEGESVSRLGSPVAPPRGRERRERGGVRGRIAQERELSVSQLCADSTPGVLHTTNETMESTV